MSFKLEDYIWKNDDYIAKEEYSPFAINQAKNIINWKGIDNAIFRKKVEAITIDWIESKDLDDAIWAEKTKNWYTVFIHIADPTALIPTYSPLDLEAISRATSIYRKDKILNMYPPILSNEYFSLNENKEKLTLTIEIELDKNTNIKDFHIYESIFKSKKRHDYKSFIDEYKNPKSENHKNFTLFYKIAKKRRKLRKFSGATLDFDESDRQEYLWRKDEKVISNYKKIPSIIVEEWAILWNICSAIFMVKNELEKVFRVHMDLKERAFYNSKSLWHKALALDFYTHFTSPIRRYPDNLVHRIIKDKLNNRNSLYDNNQIKQLISSVNKKILLINFIWKNLDFENQKEKWWAEKIDMLKWTYWKDIKIFHYKHYIRNFIHDKKTFPKNMKLEIKNLIEKWHISEWSWCIWLFLLSDEIEIKKLIKEKILKESVTWSKQVISLLNTTRILKWDTKWIFEIEEFDNTEQIIISFSLENKKIFEFIEEYDNEEQKNMAKSSLRRKTIKEVFKFFNV